MDCKINRLTRYETIVIGDLDKEDARIFWKQKLKQLEMDLADRNIHVPQWPEFDAVYSICGGNMFLISKALNYWVLQSATPPIDWYKFPYVVQEFSKLIRQNTPLM